MNRHHVLMSIGVCAVLSAAAPAFAADAQLDGQLPMYPHGTLAAQESSLTPAAIAHGVPLVLLTADPVHTVDAWYGAHVQKTCSRQATPQGTKYACSGGSIMVYVKAGQTQIALIPPMFGMPDQSSAMRP